MSILKIKSLAETKGVTIRKLAQEIGMSEQNLHKCFKRNSIETKHLEKIAQVLNVSVGYFFDEGTGSDQSMNNNQVAIGNKNKQSIARDSEMALELKDIKGSVTEIIKENQRLNKELHACKDEMLQLLKKRK